MKIPKLLLSAGVVAFGLFALVHVADVALGRPILPWGDFPWILDPKIPPATLRLHAVRDVLCYSLLAVVPVCLFGRWARLVLVPGFCCAVVLDVAVYATYATYHASLGELWPTVFLNSSAEEALQFLKMSLTPDVLKGLFALLVVLVAGSVLIAKAHYPRVSRRSVALGLALLLPFAVCHLFLTEPRYGIREMAYADFAVRSALTWTRLKGIGQACSGNPQLPERLACAAADEQRPNVVIVLGESASRNYWHLYGYARQTTPRMDALCREGNGGVCFRDVVSVHGETTEAICMLLSDVSFDNPTVGHWTLAEVYQRAGYRGTLITNQFLWKFEKDLLLARIFNGCVARVNVPEEFPQDEKTYDERTVALLKRELERTPDRPQLVFVHLAGAHFPVEKANPKSENHFSDAVEGDVLADLAQAPEARDRCNRYDNAMLYEDKVLGQLVDVVKSASRRPACLVYLSDHGESPRAGSWRDYANDDLYEVPCVLWFSESYQKAFPDVVASARRAATRPMQSDEMTCGLIELGRITGLPNVRPEQSFLNDGFRGRHPRKVDKGRRTYAKDILPREQRP